MPEIRQGQIYDYDFGAAEDQRQAGLRPAIVIQSNALNEVAGYGLTVVMPLTTKGRPSPTYVRIDPTSENGLSEISFVKCEQPYTVARARLTRFRGSVGKQDMYRIFGAMKIVFGLP